MNERHIPRWAMAAVALVVLFGIGSLLYNSGYSSGMVTGMLVSSSEGGAMTPYLLARTGGLHGGFGFFGGLLRIGFFLFFLALIAKFFGFMRWKMHMKHNGESDANGSHNFQGFWEAHREWHRKEEAGSSAAEQPAPPSPPAQDETK